MFLLWFTSMNKDVEFITFDSSFTSQNLSHSLKRNRLTTKGFGFWIPFYLALAYYSCFLTLKFKSWSLYRMTLSITNRILVLASSKRCPTVVACCFLTNVNHLILWTPANPAFVWLNLIIILFAFVIIILFSLFFLCDLCFVTLWCRCCAAAAEKKKKTKINIWIFECQRNAHCICLSVCRL